MTAGPIAVVEALVAAFNRRDGAAIAGLLAEGVVCAGIPLDPAHGRAATMEMLAPFLAAEEIDWRILAIAANGATIFTERDDRFRFAGKDWTSVRAAGIFEIDGEGRIAAWRDYFDLAELERAMP
ncbi:MAG: limonene-1,2-epoxide hydrolase family protein [Sphingopyxis sp.]|uniref:limonene-1,2-epoxide hydrolase family protein n=1 Tax=Sphingopyxis sp. TaxID=1908224 RepID=UPI003D6CB7FD